MDNNRNKDILADIIHSSKIYIILLVIVLVLGVAGYVIFQSVLDKKNSVVLELMESSEEQYEKIITSFPPFSSLKTADEDTIVSLINKYDNITDNYNNSFSIEEAFHKKGKLYIVLQEYEKAINELELSLKTGKKSSYLQVKTLANLASLYEEQGDSEKAKEYYQTIVDVYPNKIEFPHALFSLGRLAEVRDRQKNTKTAQGIYLQLVENDIWGGTDWVSLAKSRLAFLGYTGYTSGNTNDEQ